MCMKKISPEAHCKSNRGRNKRADTVCHITAAATMHASRTLLSSTSVQILAKEILFFFFENLRYNPCF